MRVEKREYRKKVITSWLSQQPLRRLQEEDSDEREREKESSVCLYMR